MNITEKTRRLLMMVVMLTAGLQLFADDEVTFTAQAPQAVVQGERFRITYKVNSRDVKDFRSPVMPASLSVLTGPSTSSSSNTQITNGKVTSTYTLTYTYTVVANEEGTVELDGATIKAGGKQLSSNKLTIKVLPPDKATQSSGGQGQGSSQQNRGGSSAQSGEISGSDLFMLATVDKTTVYEQEALLLSFKVYVAPSMSGSLSSLSTKMPDLKNFHVQEVELPQRKEFQMEHYNGRNYQTMLWTQYVLFPQHSGELEIPATTFEGVVSQPVASNDVFDFFFNAGRYVDVKKELSTRAIKITVKPLPSGKTSAFYGGVGDFSISSTINATELTANDAVTVRVVLSGTGNLKLVKTPEIKFPQDFDIYDPKVENKYTIKGGRQTGNKVFEYLAIPRHGGQYTIPALEFQYFDPKSGTYKTIQTDEYTLNVAKGQGGGDSQTSVAYVSKEDLKFVGQDVRFHNTPAAFRSTKDLFFGSTLFYLLLLLPVIILIAVSLISAKRIRDNANVAKVRTRKASSVASKRLKTAHKLMKEGRKNEFYDEMMHALTGYMADKLSIPVAELSKENIENQLLSHHVDEVKAKAVVHLLDNCEFARFAPGDDTGRMDRLYDEAVNVIGQIENTIK